MWQNTKRRLCHVAPQKESKIKEITENREKYLPRIEHELFSSTHPLNQYVIAWIRYIDDVFFIWKSTSQQLRAYQEHLHSSGPGTKFISELETENQ